MGTQDLPNHIKKQSAADTVYEVINNNDSKPDS